MLLDFRSLLVFCRAVLVHLRTLFFIYANCAGTTTQWPPVSLEGMAVRNTSNSSTQCPQESHSPQELFLSLISCLIVALYLGSAASCHSSHRTASVFLILNKWVTVLESSGVAGTLPCVISIPVRWPLSVTLRRFYVGESALWPW